MAHPYDTVWFLSDFGLEDEFVGVVKAVIRGIAPHVTVVDITHQIPPYDTRAGGLALVRSIQYLPSGVVLAVVDPGVGTERRALAVEAGGYDGESPGGDGGADGRRVFLGPDNGLLASAVAFAGGARRAFSLTNRDYQLPSPGPTFAGRDVFAPAAAHLCTGVDPAELGDRVDPLSLLPGTLPLSRQEEGRVVGEVLWVDRYGNAQLNVDPDDVAAMGARLVMRYREETRTVVRVSAFAELGRGQVGLVVDSYGLLAVAIPRGSAAQELRLAPGDAVTLEGAG